MISVLVFIVTVLVGIAIVGFLAELVYFLAGLVGTVIGAVLYAVIIKPYRSHQLRSVLRPSA